LKQPQVFVNFAEKNLIMDKTESFKQKIAQGYTCQGGALIMGSAMLDGEGVPGALVKIPLKTMNRHGLIAGATGTGKTKTLQIIAEQLSENGVPVLLMDIKGDLSGIAQPGSFNKHVEKRHSIMGVPWEGKGVPVEFLSLSDEKGARMRATVIEFGPVLLSRILELNDTQAGVVSLAFKYCDDNGIPLLDLKDFKKVLQYLSNEGKDEIKEDYGSVSTTSVSTIMRKILEIEQQGADRFFGEESFNVEDLLRTNMKGQGMVSILRLTDIQDRPKLFSTFMLALLAEIYNTFPEVGDAEKPKLVIFIDEAHLIFNEASKALLNQIETIVRLIRSKGVGIYFCTQNPGDVPDEILGQLGLKIQHALRAFTAKDRQMINKTAENYPESEFYDVPELLTSLGIGEALITALDEKGRPAPLAATLLRAPMSRMDVLAPQEIDVIIKASKLVPYYNREIDRESAFEMLSAKIGHRQSTIDNRQSKGAGKVDEETGLPDVIEEISKNPMARQIGRTLVSELTRGIFGMLGGRRRR
jgi:DNA helicase HerA-like ATPase